jgi:AcrR family transcriptional regulator
MKQRIIDKAMVLFGKYGYSSIKTDQLASDLGISKRTLYKYFPSKKVLLESVMTSINERTERNMNNFFDRLEKDKDNIIEFLIEAFENNLKISSVLSDVFFVDIKKNLPQILDSFVLSREENIRKNFEKIYDIGLEMGYFREVIHKDILYLIHFFSLKYILHPDVLSHLSLSITEALRQIHLITMTGALTEKGVKRFDKVKERLESFKPIYFEKN